MEELFQSIGLSQSKARDTMKNAAVSNSLQAYILEVQALYTWNDHGMDTCCSMRLC